MNFRTLSFAAVSVAAASVAQAQNAAPVALNPLPNLTLYAGASAEVIDLTDAFQDPDMSRAVRLTTVEGVIDFAIFDRQKPITATNFLRYVNEGRYFSNDATTGQQASTFFHRSVPDFVIQAGGFIGKVNPNDPNKENAQPTQVQTFAAIQNEPGISNKRGTVAMAKLGGDPNSATSQWFINLKDNSGPPASLDTQNGGFTVFARVIGNGMNVADRIAGLPIVNAATPVDPTFSELPVRNYTSGAIKVANLVSIPQIAEIAAVHSPLNFSATTDNADAVEFKVSGDKLLVNGKNVGTANITVTATDLDGASISQTFAVNVISAPSRFANISTRMEVRPDPNALIGGFFVRGGTGQRVLIRATVPQNLAGTLADPQLEVYDANGLIAENNNWGDATKQDIRDTGLAPNTAKESAVVLTLPSGADPTGYTAIVRGANNGIGIALVEIFDLSSGPGATLTNISTRGRVDTGDKVMIGGVIVAGNGSKHVLIRSRGPSLPLSETLSDPQLALINANGQTVAENNDWQSSADKDEIAATGLAPANAKEPAMIQTLPVGAFTAIVSGVNNGKGVATVEVYQLD